MLSKEKDNLIKTKENLTNLKMDIYKKFNYIENIEKEITHKISKVDIDFLEEIKIEGMV